MTLVRSRRQPLSGNKGVVLAIALFLVACSPKIMPTAAPPKPAAPAKPTAETTLPRVVTPKVFNVALLLPFNLDGLDLDGNDLSRADLAVDYYQGFKFALDSLTAKGNSYNLQVFDSKDSAPQARTLAFNAKIRSSDLIVGPVYPESVTAFTANFTANKLIVSPLSPASPAQFKSNKLVTVIPPLEYHAWAAARFITDRVKPKRVFILKSGYSEENKYIIPFRKAIDSLGKKKIQITSVIISHGNFDALLPQLSTSDENIFIVPATDAAFLTTTLNALQKVAQNYSLTVFGHPNWTKLDFLKPDLLQSLKTHITTSDDLDRKSGQMAAFIKNYKRVYHTAPGEYAIKGFDAGYYFGGLLNNGDALNHLDRSAYTGLNNQYSFIKTANYGWVNTHVTILRYQNFALKKVE